MSRKLLAVVLLVLGLALVAALPAKADSLDYADATVTCTGYQVLFQGSGLPVNYVYVFKGSFTATPTIGSPQTINLEFQFDYTGSNGYFDYTFTGNFSPALSGNVTFSGTAELTNAAGDIFNTRPITFSPTSLTGCTPPPPPCSATSTNSSNFNGTKVPAGDYVWFNSNFTASGIPSSGAVITLTNSTISFTANGTAYNLAVPNAQITFSPTATCTSTTFNSMTGTWMTTVPVKGDDEIFLSGLAWPIPAPGLPGGVNPVNWTGTFGTNGISGVTIQWKWGAAAYSQFTTNYNQLSVKPGHQTACGASNGDHAGTPEGVNNNNQPWKQFVVGGTRGGGGSNWTGSWSGTQHVTPVCQ